MLNYPAIYFLIAVGSAGIAFSGVATGSIETVRGLFVLFLAASLVSALIPRRGSLSLHREEGVAPADDLKNA